MKEKELVSFVSFAVQFCKVCAVYIDEHVNGNDWKGLIPLTEVLKFEWSLIKDIL